jgi:drug/metabolite transporter (DMT)-like permease
MIIQLIDYLKQHQRTVSIIASIGIAVMLVWTMVGVDTSHAHTWMEKSIPGFWALFTLLACVVLIFFARWLGKSGIMTREDHYDD